MGVGWGGGGWEEGISFSMASHLLPVEVDVPRQRQADPDGAGGGRMALRAARGGR